MRLFLNFLPALGCAGAMVACARMMRGHHGAKASSASPSPTVPNESIQYAGTETQPASTNT